MRTVLQYCNNNATVLGICYKIKNENHTAPMPSIGIRVNNKWKLCFDTIVNNTHLFGASHRVYSCQDLYNASSMALLLLDILACM